jgi:hypothetical protein
VSAHSHPRMGATRTPPTTTTTEERGGARLPVARKSISPTYARIPIHPPDSDSPGAGFAGTLLWRQPRLCSRTTQFSAQFPTLIPRRKTKQESQANVGNVGGALATHASALGGAHRPLGAGRCSCSCWCGLQPSGPHSGPPGARLSLECAQRRGRPGTVRWGYTTNRVAKAEVGAWGLLLRSPRRSAFRAPSRADKSRRAVVWSSPGRPPLQVFPAAAAVVAGEVQVARRPH